MVETYSYRDHGEIINVGYEATPNADGFVGRITSETALHAGAIDKIVWQKLGLKYATISYVLRGSQTSVRIDGSRIYEIDADGRTVREVGSWTSGNELLRLKQATRLQYTFASQGSRWQRHFPAGISREPGYIDLGTLTAIEFIAQRQEPPSSFTLWGIPNSR